MDVAGADILYLALTGVLYTILVFVVEYFEDTGQL
jgi:ATP-binding cassette subfamily A (ABC1) protein 3